MKLLFSPLIVFYTTQPGLRELQHTLRLVFGVGHTILLPSAAAAAALGIPAVMAASLCPVTELFPK